MSLAEPVPHSSLLPPVMPLTVTSLAELDRRIDELTEERAEQSLGGPIATMAVGGGALLFGGYLLFLNFIFSSACDSDDEGCDDDTGLAVPGTVGVVVGAGLLLGGGLWLGDRVGTRRELAREITALERQRERVERVSPTVDLSNDEFTLVRPRGFRGVRLTLEF